LIYTINETKAPHVERAQRSFQNILYRMMEEKQTNSSIHLLKDVLNIYNNRINRITGLSPNNAYKDKNKDKVLKNLEKYYKTRLDKKRKPLYKVGDKVRISTLRNKFERGYSPKFSEEVFKVRQILTNLPQPRYILENYAGDEVIDGSFYERELTLATHEDFKIEQILKERKIKGKNNILLNG